MSLITLSNLTKVYTETASDVVAVDSVQLTLEAGEFAALVGPSGCGKTTLLNLIGGLDRPTAGSVVVSGTDLSTLSDADLVRFRLEHIGFVFQAYNLIPVLTALENTVFILELQGVAAAERNRRGMELLDAVGLADKAHHRPAQLSGGQQQRVAVARALASKPAFVLADEPTANLDSKSASKLLDIMLDLNRTEGTLFLFSTHDPRVVDRARRTFHLEDGRVLREERKS
ncbi:MAG: ABC transporter ATP-binding protein [Schleiferiaceae bacterium]|jgi:putative ABC transport system ATP-binding protein|nr:ABC transporter ATP-binding protein [Schleiferiaceae bacterium]MDP4627023.1 ABC transporter ATP-binding protein [Schleiferiaceae bacterium]MDP4728274.1 ABC transporter ATP-binding protein [Schleiferiaceae bacterium]MDP4749474.1 ABC transporter ATP-binding protein [Schleiferiaceae bacterium]MDP4858928.1 ABC transporter ATP-binding protein [Schleiferiaceae bacterium]